MKEFSENSIGGKIKQLYNFKNITLSIGFSIFIAIVFVYINYNLLPQLNPFVNAKVLFGQVAVIIVLSLTVTYFYAFKFFNKSLYFFMSAGWLANALYLLFEFFFNDHCFTSTSPFCREHPNNNFCIDDNLVCLEYSIGVYLFSLLSTVSFYIATSRRLQKNEPAINKISVLGSTLTLLKKIPLIVWLGIAAMPALLIYFTSAKEKNSVEYGFMLSTIGGSIFTSYCLFYLGYKFQCYLNEENKSDNDSKNSLTLKLFPYTFYFYGLLQFSYPFKLFLLKPHYELDLLFTTINFTWLRVLFIIASGLKLLNIAGLMVLLLRIKYHDYIRTREENIQTQKEYQDTQKELEFAKYKLSQKNHLATLGAISASIEHDLKTPLGNLNTDIMAMKKLYANYPKLIPYLNRLENHKNKMSAIAKVIPFIRASNDFYDTDEYMGRNSVSEIINSSIRALKKELTLDTKNISFTKDEQNCYIRAYPEMIEQIFTNLFKNSVEAIQEKGKDGGVIHIITRFEKELPDEVRQENQNAGDFNKWVRVDVIDEGCGIAAENIPELTSLYTSKGEKKPNGGIGLFIANIILEIHEALIHFQSKVGEGTKVSVFFPEWEAYLQANKKIESEQKNKQTISESANSDKFYKTEFNPNEVSKNN